MCDQDKAAYIQKMKRLIHIYSLVVTWLTNLVILMASVFYVSQLVGIKLYVVLSGSMEPAIPTGSAAFVDTRDADVSIGNIVTYKLPSVNGGETLVTHRIIREEDGNWITKGDANDVEDLSPVSQEQIMGSYCFLIPMAGYLIAQLNKKILIVIAFWIFLLNGISLALSFVFEEDEENKTAKEKLTEESGENESGSKSETDMKLDLGGSEL